MHVATAPARRTPKTSTTRPAKQRTAKQTPADSSKSANHTAKYQCGMTKYESGANHWVICCPDRENWESLCDIDPFLRRFTVLDFNRAVVAIGITESIEKLAKFGVPDNIAPILTDGDPEYEAGLRAQWDWLHNSRIVQNFSNR
jgi:hypothetical protein